MSRKPKLHRGISSEFDHQVEVNCWQNPCFTALTQHSIQSLMPWHILMFHCWHAGSGSHVSGLTVWSNMRKDFKPLNSQMLALNNTFFWCFMFNNLKQVIRHFVHSFIIEISRLVTMRVLFRVWAGTIVMARVRVCSSELPLSGWKCFILRVGCLWWSSLGSSSSPQGGQIGLLLLLLLLLSRFSRVRLCATP